MMKTERQTRYLTVAPREEARVRLYCFPHAGGGATTFYPWTRRVPEWLQVLPVHLPGRENRHDEPPILDMASLVADLKRELVPHLRSPFAVFGHSLGALVAHELVRTLLIPPVRFFVSSSRAPQLPRRSPPLYQLPEGEFLAAMQTRYQALPAVVLADREMLALYLAVLRADFTLFDTYAYSPFEPLPCPISALGGEQDGEVSAESLSAWRERTKGAFNQRLFPGGHFYPKEQQTALLQVLTAELS